VGSIDKRIEALERLYGVEHEVDPAEMVRRREEFKVKLLRVREKADAEAAAGNPRRREQLYELEEHMKRRVAERQARGR
jgi:hypothetical protein